MKAQGQEVAAASLIDPSSAQFRNVELRRVPANKVSPVVICGEINGKNRQGAYVGFARFLASPTAKEVLLDPQSVLTDADIEYGKRRCSSAGPIYSEVERDLRIMQCKESIEHLKEKMSQDIFDAAWSGACTPKPATS